MGGVSSQSAEFAFVKREGSFTRDRTGWLVTNPDGANRNELRTRIQNIRPGGGSARYFQCAFVRDSDRGRLLASSDGNDIVPVQTDHHEWICRRVSSPSGAES